MTSNNTDKDIIPPLSLDYDCCAPEGKRTKLNSIHLNLPLKNAVNRLEDLRLASHKFEEVDRLISEQEWKIRQSKVGNHLCRHDNYQPFLDYSLLLLLLQKL
jgi:hypothetical protein